MGIVNADVNETLQAWNNIRTESSITIPHYDNQQQNNQLSKCPNCGHEIGDWDFCFYCGTNLKAQPVAELSNERVEKTESSTDNTIEYQQDKIEIKPPVCPNCGKEIGEWDFCFHCGTNLKAQSVAELPNEEVENPESITHNPGDTVEDQREVAEVNIPCCPNCGKEIGDWDFCFHCGTNLKAQSGTALSDEDVKTPESATDNTLEDTVEIQRDDTENNVPTCPICGKEIGEWDFCFHCGTNLKTQPLSEVSEAKNAEPIKDTAFVMVDDPEREGNNSPDISKTTINEPELSNNNDNIIILEDENGNELEYIFLDLIQYRNKVYVVLLPNDDSVELVTILQFEEAPDGTEHYSSVENDFTLQVVFEIFKERAKNDFNFID